MIELEDSRILRLVTNEDLRSFDAGSVIFEDRITTDHRLHLTWIGHAAGRGGGTLLREYRSR